MDETVKKCVCQKANKRQYIGMVEALCPGLKLQPRLLTIGPTD